MSKKFITYRGVGYLEANRELSNAIEEDNVELYYDVGNFSIAIKEIKEETSDSYKVSRERKGSKIKRICAAGLLGRLGKEVKKGKYPVKRHDGMWVVDLVEDF